MATGLTTPGRVVIIGGGLAGLACGRALARESGHVPPDVHVLEAESRAGGKALTDVEGGWVLEWGPQTFVDEDGGPLRALIEKLGLTDEVVSTRPDARLRYVLREGRLHAVPRDVAGLLGLPGLLRAASEAFRRARRADAAEETVHEFAARRFGERAARLLFGALVTGIYAGDANRLSLRSALPRVHALEQQHGSLMRALVTGGFVPRRSSTLRRGLGSLTDALARDLGLRLRLATPVEALRPPTGASGSAGATWTVTTAAGEESADAVVLACPAFASAGLVRPFDPTLATALDAIPYAPVTAVVLGYDRAAFPDGAPRGFGFLVPPGQARVLGCLFPTSTFDGMAPDGKVMLRVLVGGALDPASAALDDDAVTRLARAAVEPILKVRGEPELVRVLRHAQAIPQYNLGHEARVAAIDARVAALPGLFVTGNAYRGVSLVDVAADAARTAEQVRAALMAT